MPTSWTCISPDMFVTMVEAKRDLPYEGWLTATIAGDFDYLCHRIRSLEVKSNQLRELEAHLTQCNATLNQLLIP